MHLTIHWFKQTILHLNNLCEYCPHSLRFDSVLLWVRQLKVSELKEQLKLYHQKISGLKVSAVSQASISANHNRPV